MPTEWRVIQRGTFTVSPGSYATKEQAEKAAKRANETYRTNDYLAAELGVVDTWDFPEGSTAVCLYCDRRILLDQREGGGPGKDWGDGPDTWVGNGGIGMDYGCGDNPENDDEGTGGHYPKPGTIFLP